MKKLIKDWDELLIYEKVFRVLTMVFAVATIVFVVLSEQDKVDHAFVQLSMGLTMLCQGIHFWRKSKGTAIFSLCTATFVFLVVMIYAFL